MRRNNNRLLQWLLLLAIFPLMSGCSMPVQHGLSERQANKILVLLARATPPIEAQKVKNAEGREVKWSIVVSNSDAPRAIAILQANNLPPKADKGFSEIYGKTGMIPTATEERAKYLMALSGELTRTIKKITGILDARVHLVIPKEKILHRPGAKQALPKASVLLLVKSNYFNTGRKRIVLRSDIRKIVGFALERLHPQNVQVVIRAGDVSVGVASKADMQGGGGEFKKVIVARVMAEDANKLRILLGVIFLLLGIFIVLFLVFFFKASSLKNQLNL